MYWARRTGLTQNCALLSCPFADLLFLALGLSINLDLICSYLFPYIICEIVKVIYHIYMSSLRRYWLAMGCQYIICSVLEKMDVVKFVTLDFRRILS